MPTDNHNSWIIEDADFLYNQGRKHGAILLLLCAVDALAKKHMHEIEGNKKRFVAYLTSRMRRAGRGGQIHNVGHPRTGVAIPYEELIYKFLRNPLVHEAAWLDANDSEYDVVLDWVTIPHGQRCDRENMRVILGGEHIYGVLKDAVSDQLPVVV